MFFPLLPLHGPFIFIRHEWKALVPEMQADAKAILAGVAQQAKQNKAAVPANKSQSKATPTKPTQSVNSTPS